MKTLFLLAFLTSFVFGNYNNTYTREQVKKDFENQDTQKYRIDNLVTLNQETLLKKGIIGKKEDLIREIPADFKYSDFRKYATCSFVDGNYTATIYNLDLKGGVVTCMVAQKRDLYNPIGVFNTYYPNLKKNFLKNEALSRQVNQTHIQHSDRQFEGINAEKQFISDSTKQNSASEYLSIPELLLGVVTTNTDIIDGEETAITGKLQLKQNFTSKVYDQSGGFVENSDNILIDAGSIFKIFTSISDISMSYLALLVFFFAAYGITRSFASPAFDKIEGKKNYDKKIPYVLGLVAGILFFFPTSDHEKIYNQTGEVAAEYELFQTRFMNFQQDGYSLFGSWADEIAKAIIDTEIETVIQKSGVGTKEQIINSYTGVMQYSKLLQSSEQIFTECKNRIYKYDYLADDAGRPFYTDNPNVLFPTSESWAYAKSIYGSGATTNYYAEGNRGLVLKSGYSQSILNKSDFKKEDYIYYPDYSISACGKVYHQAQTYQQKLNDFQKSYDTAIISTPDDSKKIEALRTLISSQYKMYRDWGYLSILGIPVLKMQSEMIGNLYTNRSNEVIEKLNEKIGDSPQGKIFHSMLSSVPYMFIPGMSTVYNSIQSTTRDLKNDFSKTAVGRVGDLLGLGMVTSVSSSIAGFTIAYTIGKAILTLVPIIGVLLLGLLQFTLIIIRIFTIHFSSLFVMPIMFVRKNTEAIITFFVKVLSTMLELPIFVLSVWLAGTASSIFYTIGSIFTKNTIIDMLENSESQHSIGGVENIIPYLFDTVKLYLFAGFAEVFIAGISIVIIYKIIITLRNAIFELMEVNAMKSLDGMVENIQNESKNWGTRM